MSFIVGLTIAIALMTSRHAVTWVVVLWGGVIVGLWIGKGRIRSYGSIMIQRSVGIICGLIAVVIYDARILGGQGMTESYQGWYVIREEIKDPSFIIVGRERANRYLIEESPSNLSLDKGKSEKTEDQGKYSHNGRYFLQIEQEIPIGSVISIADGGYIRQRQYRPKLCFSLICDTGHISDTRRNETGETNPTADPRGRHIFDYDKWLRMRGIDAVYYPSFVGIQTDTSHIGWMDRVRQSFLSTIQHYYGTDVVAGLIAGMTIGDTSMMSKERQQQFINSSLIHIVAVSGGNIAIVLMIFGLLLWWMPFYIRQSLLIGGVIMYAVFVGDDSSIMRATIMAVLTLLAISSGRLVSIRRLLAYARCGMLLRSPYVLMHDLGFVLSFCAVAGILRAEDTMKILKKEKTATVNNNTKKRISDWLYRAWSVILVTSIVPSIGAAIGVTPILLGSTGTINLTGVVANIVIAALIPPLTIGGLIVGALGNIWWLSRPIMVVAMLVKRCIVILLWVSSITTQYGIYLTWSGPGQILILWIGLLFRGWYGREDSRAKKEEKK